MAGLNLLTLRSQNLGPELNNTKAAGQVGSLGITGRHTIVRLDRCF